MKKWLLIILVAVVLAAGAWVADQLYSPFRGYTGNVVLVIRQGAHAEDVAGQLARRGVLRRRLPFLLRYWVGRRHQQSIKYGEYLFDRPLSASQVYEKLIRGEVYLHTVVIPEGSDRFDTAGILQREIGLDPERFLAATRDPSRIRDLDPGSPTLEGYLFPDTYRFPQGAPASRVVQTMLRRFRHVWEMQIRPGMPPGVQNLHDVITLASLIEKETPAPQERPLIAGVFTRRLQLRMPLQCDPTVIYALRLDRRAEDPFKGPLTASDLEVNSPYNTYTHAGLPPGPICSPGLASIEAALHPAPGKALYFVSNNHGGHVFADTLTQQNRNVAHYRKQLKENQSDGREPREPVARHHGR